MDLGWLDGTLAEKQDEGSRGTHHHLPFTGFFFNRDFSSTEIFVPPVNLFLFTKRCVSVCVRVL